MDQEYNKIPFPILPFGRTVLLALGTMIQETLMMLAMIRLQES